MVHQCPQRGECFLYSDTSPGDRRPAESAEHENFFPTSVVERQQFGQDSADSFAGVASAPSVVQRCINRAPASSITVVVI